ncbi:metal ABC transporter substrate-binding protein [Terrisporobacter glycolicus]|uniref:metal ABC transporter substrate-binding protein n=1 Tax=Terrisporobacter glycolicus TaxID=36841 RepID=UPI000AFCAC00
MKKIISLLLVIPMLFTIGCSKENKTDENSDGKIKIYTSIYPLYDFAKKVGGDKVEVTNLVPAGTEPHDWEISTSDIVNLEKADMLIYNGAGIENWTDKVIDTLENKDIVYVKTSEGLDIHKAGEKANSNKDDGHSHGSFDPHTWLSIKNAKKEMKNIKDALIKHDSENTKYYEKNYEKYAKKLDELDKKYSDTLGPIKNKTIIVAHEAFGYLCSDYNINQEGIEGLTPDSEPDPARMREIIKFAKENNVKTIFFEELVSPKVAETIAKEINAKTEVLNPLEGLSEEQINNGEDYFSVMEKNLEALYESMK